MLGSVAPLSWHVACAGVLDEMALTLAPTVVGGAGPRMTDRAPLNPPDGIPLRPHLLLEEAGTLLGLWRVRR